MSYRDLPERLLRCCSYCSAFILTSNGRSQYIACPRCAAGKNPGTAHMIPKPHDVWAAGLKPGDRCYVQPYVAWRGLSHSEHIVIAREGDSVTVQIVGLPESRTTTTIAHLGQQDLTPRRQTGALD